MMKKLILASALLFLTACGFTPMHAANLGENGAAFKNIRIDLETNGRVESDEGAFWVQQALYDRLGKSGTLHVLTIKPSFGRGSLGISAQDVATRYDLTARIDYTLRDAKTDKVLDTGRVSTVTTFASSKDPYSRAASEQNATQNSAKEVADRLLVRLAAYYANADK